MYNIKISKIEPPADGKAFENEKTVYEQRVESLDLEAVIAVINGLTKPEKK